MAKEISTKFSVDMSSVVQNSIESVRLVRRSEQARKESEFQRAIANGLSYEEQLSIREKQLKEEKSSHLSDPDYVISLEKSIADTKKLNRFNKYRSKYAETLGDLSAGKINEEQYLETLQNQLSNIDDPELRLEVQGDITAAHAKVKSYKDTILSNQVKKAKYDGTKSALDDAIARVNNARTQALINENEDEVGAYDETLSALQSQLSTVKIQDSITDFQVKSSTRGTDAVEKLNFINDEISKADPNSPIKIGDRTYSSAQQFWSLERDNYLAGSSNIFGKFFNELDVDIKNNVDTSTNTFGYPTQNVLDATLYKLNELRTRPEILPFISRLETTQAAIMSDAVDKIAKAVAEVGEFNVTHREADSVLEAIGNKYGVDTTPYRIKLAEKFVNLERGGIISHEELVSGAPEFVAKIPTFTAGTTPLKSITEPNVPTVPRSPSIIPVAKAATSPTQPAQPTPVTPPQTVSAPTTPQEPKVTPITPSTPAATTTPSVVTPVSTPQPVVSTTTPPVISTTTIPTPTEESPQYTPLGGVGTKSPGGKFVFTGKDWEPVSSVAPQSTPVTQSSSIPKEEPLTPQFSPLKGVGATYTNREGTTFRFNEQRQWEQISSGVREKPKTQKATTYTGSSIVDYLKSVGQDSSLPSRAKLAVEKGVVKSEEEYLKAAEENLNATMNTRLLELLRKQ